MLAGLAARTSTIALGLLVAGVGYRNPAQHAKITTTLDVISGGRAFHGIGAGWFEAEHLRLRVRVPAAEGALRAPRGPPADRAGDVHRGAGDGRGHPPLGRAAPTTTRSRCAATSRSSSAAAASARRCGWSPSTPTAATSSATPSVRGICSACWSGTARTSGATRPEITKTSMMSIAIAETEAGARRKLDDAARPGLPEQRIAGTTAGTPEQILRARARLPGRGDRGPHVLDGRRARPRRGRARRRDAGAACSRGPPVTGGRGAGEVGGRAGRAPRDAAADGRRTSCRARSRCSATRRSSAPSTTSRSARPHCAGSPTSPRTRGSRSSPTTTTRTGSALWWARADGTARVVAPGAEPELRAAAVARSPPAIRSTASSRRAGALVVIAVDRWSGWSAA